MSKFDIHIHHMNSYENQNLKVNCVSRIKNRQLVRETLIKALFAHNKFTLDK